jgi:hypothetical protein
VKLDLQEKHGEGPENKLSEAVSYVIARMNNWMESIKELTEKTEAEMLDCLQQCAREEQTTKQDEDVSKYMSTERALPSCSSKKLKKMFDY